MIFIRSFVSILVLLLFNSLFAINAFSQVVTAPFDPTTPVLMSAATGWREGVGVGVVYYERSGERKLDNQLISKSESTGTNLNAIFKMSNVSLEGFYSGRSSDVSLIRYFDGRINLDRTETRLAIAMSGNDFVSVGLGGHGITSSDYFDVSHDSEKTTQTRVGGSISIKTADVLFLGCGFERVKTENTFVVDNGWNTVTAGLALKLGEPGETRMRLEYSFALSPYVKSEAQGNLAAAEHNETRTSRLSGDLMISGLLFSTKWFERKELLKTSRVYGGEQVDETVNKRIEIGVLWVPPNGLLAGFYFSTEEGTDIYFDEYSAFRVHLGYLF